jgi:hypothetical protein
MLQLSPHWNSFCNDASLRLRLNLEFVEAGLGAAPTDERWADGARQLAGVGDLALNKDSELILYSRISRFIVLVSRLRPLVYDMVQRDDGGLLP